GGEERGEAEVRPRERGRARRRRDRQQRARPAAAARRPKPLERGREDDADLTMRRRRTRRHAKCQMLNAQCYMPKAFIFRAFWHSAFGIWHSVYTAPGCSSSMTGGTVPLGSLGGIGPSSLRSSSPSITSLSSSRRDSSSSTVLRS